MALASSMVPIGTPAPDFTLPAIDGGKVSLETFAGEPVLAVVFLSNHCPYVRRIEQALGAVTAELSPRGLATVAICSNDTGNYPDDDAAHLRDQVRRAGFRFPYLVDETQQVARAYQAACTPDLFLYDADRRLAYRGRFDAATPEIRNPPTVPLCEPLSSRCSPHARCPNRMSRASAAASNGGTAERPAGGSPHRADGRPHSEPRTGH